MQPACLPAPPAAAPSERTSRHQAGVGPQQAAHGQDLGLCLLLHGVQLSISRHAAHAQLGIDVVLLGATCRQAGRGGGRAGRQVVQMRAGSQLVA